MINMDDMIDEITSDLGISLTDLLDMTKYSLTKLRSMYLKQLDSLMMSCVSVIPSFDQSYGYLSLTLTNNRLMIFNKIAPDRSVSLIFSRASSSDNRVVILVNIFTAVLARLAIESSKYDVYTRLKQLDYTDDSLIRSMVTWITKNDPSDEKSDRKLEQ